MATLHTAKQVATAFQREYAKTPAKLKVQRDVLWDYVCSCIAGDLYATYRPTITLNAGAGRLLGPCHRHGTTSGGV